VKLSAAQLLINAQLLIKMPHPQAAIIHKRNILNKQLLSALCLHLTL